MISHFVDRLRRDHRPYRLLQVEPALACGLRCVMCPWLAMRTPESVMDRATFARVASHFTKARAVDLTGGGEPAGNALLPEMVRAAAAAGCTVGFSTNGMVLTSPMAEELVAGGLDWVCFSVDAATSATYHSIRRGAEFATVQRHIAAMAEAARRRRHPLRLMMAFVMMQENYRELPEYVDLAHRLGASQVILKNVDVILKEGDDERRVFRHDTAPATDVRQAVHDAQHAARALHLPLRVYGLQPEETAVCEADPQHSVFINWEGTVSPCITLCYAEDRIFDGAHMHAPRLRFGNLNQHSLEEIWAQPAYVAFRQTFQLRAIHERQAAINQLVGGPDMAPTAPPPPPAGCGACYYLYGV